MRDSRGNQDHPANRAASKQTHRDPKARQVPRDNQGTVEVKGRQATTENQEILAMQVRF
jgi:hypothetical protein